MYYAAYEKNGRYYDRYRQRITASLGRMLMECDAAMRVAVAGERADANKA